MLSMRHDSASVWFLVLDMVVSSSTFCTIWRGIGFTYDCYVTTSILTDAAICIPIFLQCRVHVHGVISIAGW